MNDLNWGDYFDNDREAGVTKEERCAEAIDELIAELEGAKVLLEDGELDQAFEELQCQEGTIKTIGEMIP